MTDSIAYFAKRNACLPMSLLQPFFIFVSQNCPTIDQTCLSFPNSTRHPLSYSSIFSLSLSLHLSHQTDH